MQNKTKKKRRRQEFHKPSHVNIAKPLVLYFPRLFSFLKKKGFFEPARAVLTSYLGYSRLAQFPEYFTRLCDAGILIIFIQLFLRLI